MRKLTQSQMNQIGVFNVYEFVGKNGWWVQFHPYWAMNRSHFGWYLETQRTSTKIGYGALPGNKNPVNIALLPAIVKGLRFDVPKTYVKVFGGWVPSDIYEARMQALVEQYKDLKVTA